MTQLESKLKNFNVFFILFFFSCQFFSQEIDSIIPKNNLKSATLKIDTSFVKKKVFDENKINEYKNKDEFIYEIEKQEPTIFQRFWIWLKTSVVKFLRYLFDDITAVVGVFRVILEILPYLILAVGIFFIVKYFSNISSTSILESKQIQNAQFLEDSELIESDHLETLLQQSIEDKNYRLAVRFYYLLLLKKLTDSNVIVWEQQKTNEDYIKELLGKSYQQEFKESTKLYDFVWYGKFNLNEKEFEKAHLIFTKVLTKNFV